MTLIFLPPAEQELSEAIEFYNLQLSGLGNAFAKETFETLELIKDFPLGWQKISRHTHKSPLRRFPYLILYAVEEDSIISTAIAHQHRHPRSYLDRK